MSEGLSCLCHMPLAWRAASLEPEDHQSQMQEATLLLTALNQIESTHELEAGGPENRRLDRIEAKLDLTLHLLARTLETSERLNTRPAARSVQLTPAGAQWQEAAPPVEGTRLILEIRPSEALPLNLKLPAIALEPQAGNARVSFEELSEAVAEALYQFVFRRHRQAIRARTV
jgi:hypothetical protein